MEVVDLSEYLPPQIKEFDTETEAKIKEFQNSPEAKVYLQPKHDKFFIARYLRARKYDVNLAIQMFISVMKWREEMQVDTILETFPQHPLFQKLVDYWPASTHWQNPPLTKDGSLVLVQALGRADPSMIDVFGAETVIMFHIWSMENLEKKYWEIVAEKGYWPGFVMIEDFQGIGWHSFSSRVLKVAQEATRINQNYYPEMLRKMYIINVPSVFYMFWKGVQLWLEARSLAKMELINGGVSLVANKFDAIFDMSTIPPRLGGTGTRDIPEAGPIGTPSNKMKDKAKYKVNIARGSKHEVKQEFSAGDTVSWEFRLKDYDIGFSLAYLGPYDTQMQYIKTPERFDASKKTIQGTFVADKSGYYLFQWDNTFSWTRGKLLHYNLYKGTDLL